MKGGGPWWTVMGLSIGRRQEINSPNAFKWVNVQLLLRIAEYKEYNSSGGSGISHEKTGQTGSQPNTRALETIYKNWLNQKFYLMNNRGRSQSNA